ncbi:MAG: phenylalanine--tRNA ligase subunit alpha [Caulobacteraceae bacterium]
MADSIEDLETELSGALAAAADLAELEAARVAILGKAGRVTQLLKTLGTMDMEARRHQGPLFNGLRDRLQALYGERRSALEGAEMEARLAEGRLDLSLPAPPRRKGAVHPVMQVMEEMIAIFAELDFELAEGPDIEDDFHNFEALNFPPDHPARDVHDTFFLKSGPDGERRLLRTHTSPIQIRVMQRSNKAPKGPFDAYREPPIRIVGPGRTYRRDSDATHAPMFHQMEGLVIGSDIHMGHFKWTLETFIRRFFETDQVSTRLRPHYFPFTVPSAEMDVGCDRSGGRILIGEGSDWLEILGGGMVHPRVLEICGLDPAKWQGFAFGMGIDRLAALKYGMPDLRDMFVADLRWLAHYGFSAFAQPSRALGLS